MNLIKFLSFHMLSCFSCVLLFATLLTVAHQAPLSMGFSRQEYWSGLTCPPPGDLSNPGIEPTSLMSPALAGRFFITPATWEAQVLVAQSCLIVCNSMNCSPPGSLELSSPWNYPGKNTRVGNHSLLQGVFPTKGSNPGLLCRQILYHLSY